MRTVFEKRFNYFLVVLFLLACLFIYFFYRPEGTLINIIIGKFFPYSELLNLKQFIRSLLPLSEWIVYSLPGGLWVFSATLIAKDLKLKLLDTQVYLIWVPMCFALWLEFWQFFGVVNGRFDVVDIVVVLFFGMLAIINMYPLNIQSSQKEIFPIGRRSTAFIFVFSSVFMGHVFY